MQRIALVSFVVIILCGFTRPELPAESRGVYRFGGYSGAAVRTLNGGIFSVAVGFRATDATERAPTHRDRATALVDRLEEALGSYGESGVDISVSRIYATIREVILTVEVRDASRLERVRAEVTGALRALPDAVFVGEPGKAMAL